MNQKFTLPSPPIYTPSCSPSHLAGTTQIPSSKTAQQDSLYNIVRINSTDVYNKHAVIESISQLSSLSTEYKEYKHCLVWTGIRNQEYKLYKNQVNKILKRSSAWFLKNIYDWDCSEITGFWDLICDKDYDIQDYPSKTRNQIRRSLKDCDIRRITNLELVNEDGYGVYLAAYSRYKNIAASTVDRESWEKEIRDDNKSEFWGVFQKETQKLIAWARNTVENDMVNYNTLKAIPEFMNRHYPYFGLLYTMNKEYLGNQKLSYVTDGFRSITEHSNIQPFLEKNFLFRKAYCRVQLFYKPWLEICVKILYPFRKFIPVQNIKNLLKFEEIVRCQ